MVMSENADKKKWAVTIVPAWLSLLIILGLVILLGLVVFGMTVQLEIPFVLLTGWVTFLLKNAKALEVNGELIACGLGALVLATVGLHRLLVWVRRGKPWKWAWTFSVTSLMMMLFASSVSTTGMIHQMAWMAREPLTEDYRNYPLTENTSNAKQIFYLLVEFDEEFGELPESFDALENEDFIKDLSIFQFKPGHGSPPEPWIYLGGKKSFSDDIPALDRPVLISPRPIDGKWIVLLLDGAVKQMRGNTIRKQYPWIVERMPHLLDHD